MLLAKQFDCACLMFSLYVIRFCTETRRKTNLRTVWTVFCSFGLPYWLLCICVYSYHPCDHVFATLANQLFVQAHVATHFRFRVHNSSAFHGSRTRLVFLKFSLPLPSLYLAMYFIHCFIHLLIISDMLLYVLNVICEPKVTWIKITKSDLNQDYQKWLESRLLYVCVEWDFVKYD